MHDPIFTDFLNVQRRDGLALAAESDIVDLKPLEDPPTQRYMATWHCRGLMKQDASVVERDRWMAHIYLHDDYLRRVDPLRLVTMLTPCFAPNVYGPYVCLGYGTHPGKPLVDILFELYGIISYQNFAPHDGLNEEACRYSRRNMDRFPVDPRPLKWRAESDQHPGEGDR